MSGSKNLLNNSIRDAKEYLGLEKKVIDCEKELSTALLFAAISPVADIVSTCPSCG